MKTTNSTARPKVALHELVRRLRWALADRLSYLACKLRGHEWYVADTFHGVPGNRAAELRQQIWVEVILQSTADKIEPMLGELAQLAGENWGHEPLPSNASHEPTPKEMVPHD